MLRDMSTDRPDQTESPITVDAGHFQIEADFVSFSQFKHDNATENGLTVASVNFKVGLTNFSDIQFVLPAYTRIKTEVDDRDETVDGISDLVTRFKFNIIGNDAGNLALGIMPVIKWPTASSELGNDEIEWGVIVPVGADLPNGFGMGAMIEYDRLVDGSGTDWYNSILLSGAVGRNLNDAVGAFVELIGEKTLEDDHDWQGAFSAGFTYGINANLQLDGGVVAGLTDETDDIRLFCGISFRK